MSPHKSLKLSPLKKQLRRLFKNRVERAKVLKRANPALIRTIGLLAKKAYQRGSGRRKKRARKLYKTLLCKDKSVAHKRKYLQRGGWLSLIAPLIPSIIQGIASFFK